MPLSASCLASNEERPSMRTILLLNCSGLQTKTCKIPKNIFNFRANLARRLLLSLWWHRLEGTYAGWVFGVTA